MEATATATAIFQATARFHYPSMAQHWAASGEDAAFETLLGLLLHGLMPPSR